MPPPHPPPPRRRTTTKKDGVGKDYYYACKIRRCWLFGSFLLLMIVYILGIYHGHQQTFVNSNRHHHSSEEDLLFAELWASFLDIGEDFFFGDDDDDGVVTVDDDDDGVNVDDDDDDDDDDAMIKMEADPNYLTKPRFVAPNQLKLPKPIINVGFPKAGTSTIFNFFHCNGLKAQHWFCCDDQDNPGGTQVGKLMSRCILDNMAELSKGNTTQVKHIFDGCGDFDVYSEINGPRKFKDYNFKTLLDNGTLSNPKISVSKPRMILPQHHYLDLIHNSFPNATFVLNKRPVIDWVQSVLKWPTQLKQELPREFYAQQREYPNKHKMLLRTQNVSSSSSIHIPSPTFPGHIDDMPPILEYIYNFHNQYVRDFVKQHPSHALIEIDITHNESGIILASKFGLQSECWGHANKNNGGPSKKGPVLDINKENFDWINKQIRQSNFSKTNNNKGGGTTGNKNMSKYQQFLQSRREKYNRNNKQQQQINNNNNNNKDLGGLDEQHNMKYRDSFTSMMKRQQQKLDGTGGGGGSSTTSYSISDVIYKASREERQQQKNKMMMQMKYNRQQQQQQKNHKNLPQDSNTNVQDLRRRDSDANAYHDGVLYNKNNNQEEEEGFMMMMKNNNPLRYKKQFFAAGGGRRGGAKRGKLQGRNFGGGGGGYGSGKLALED